MQILLAWNLQPGGCVGRTRMVSMPETEGRVNRKKIDTSSELHWLYVSLPVKKKTLDSAHRVCYTGGSNLRLRQVPDSLIYLANLWVSVLVYQPPGGMSTEKKHLLVGWYWWGGMFFSLASPVPLWYNVCVR